MIRIIVVDRVQDNNVYQRDLVSFHSRLGTKISNITPLEPDLKEIQQKQAKNPLQKPDKKTGK